MMTNIYAIRDTLVNAFNAPFTCPNDAVARAMFQQHFKKNEFMCDNAQNFDLYRVGTYDDQTGSVSHPEGALPVFIVDGLQMKRSVVKNEN